MSETIRSIDHRVIDFMRSSGITVLRIALGIVFVWFGSLKLLGVSPVADLVASIAYWLPPDVVVRGLGAVEVGVGLGLVTGVAIRVVLLLFFVQMAGTFLVFLLRPEVAFQEGNPLLPTVEGEFVLKNLILIAAGLVVGSRVRKMSPGERLPDALRQRAMGGATTDPDVPEG